MPSRDSTETDAELCSEFERACERIPTYNIFNRYYHNLRNLMFPRLFRSNRTYEAPLQQFYIVMIPLKGRDHSVPLVQKMFQSAGLDRILITKEIKAGAPHYNVLVTTKYDYYQHHTKVHKKFKYTVQYASQIRDVEFVADYCFKESKNREFKEGRDYYIYSK